MANIFPSGTHIRLMRKGTPSEHYEIWIGNKKTVYPPNNWRTLNGVLNWCKTRDFILTDNKVYVHEGIF